MATFSKQERLCSKKLIDALFQSGHQLMVFPYSVRWMPCDAQSLPPGVASQVLIATSKRKFRHAVDRNRVKRLTRECYRQYCKPQLNVLLEEQNLHIVLAVNYVHNEILDYTVLCHKFDKITRKLTAAITTPDKPQN